MLHSLIETWIPTWIHWIQAWGYWGVILLMAMESSVIPLPSEVVIPPAAFLAVRDGRMSLWGVVLAGAFGSWLGSAIMYAVSRWVGRPAIIKWGRYFFISPEKLERAERFMARYEAAGIFFARLLPVVRHLISIPAGIVRMPFAKFSAVTLIGSALWCSVLAWFGKGVAERNPKALDNAKEMISAIQAESHSRYLLLGIATVAVLYFIMLRLTAPKAAAKG